VVTTYLYDFQRLKEVHYPTSRRNVIYAFGEAGAAENAAGRIATVTDDVGTETRGYHVLGNLARSTRTIDPLRPGDRTRAYTTTFQFDRGRAQYPGGGTMRLDRRVQARALVVLWVVHGTLSYVLGVHTPGLAFPESSEPSGIGYVTDLQSSGRNDNVAIGMGVVLAIVAVIWGGVRFRKQFATADFVAHLILLLLQALLILSIEAGWLWFTITTGKNAVLAFWITSYAALWVVLVATAVSPARAHLVTSENHPK